MGLELAVAVSKVATSVDGLVVLSRAAFQRALLALLGSAAVLLVGVGWMLARSYGQTARLEALAGQIEVIAAEQAQAKAATEKVSEKVDEAKQTAAEKPTIEIAPAASSAGRKPGPGAAVLVIKRARPVTSASAAPAAPPPEIRIPVQFPAPATAVPATSAAPKAP